MLVLDNIAHFYGLRLVCKDISMQILPGTVTLLAGPNGAGKSTLLQIMAGLLQPSSGQIKRGPLAAGPGQTGYLGHETFIYPDLTARENLLFWAGLYAIGNSSTARNRAVEEALDQAALLDFADEPAQGFSRGMTQRLNLARIFLQQPALLLLDEPATGLDAKSVGILQTAVAAAKQRGAAVVWISHQVDQDAAYADQIVFLDDKKLTFSGPPQEFFQRRNPDNANAADSQNLPPAREGLPC